MSIWYPNDWHYPSPVFSSCMFILLTSYLPPDISPLPSGWGNPPPSILWCLSTMAPSPILVRSSKWKYETMWLSSTKLQPKYPPLPIFFSCYVHLKLTCKIFYGFPPPPGTYIFILAVYHPTSLHHHWCWFISPLFIQAESFILHFYTSCNPTLFTTCPTYIRVFLPHSPPNLTM